MLFSPAVAVLDRLRYPYKFALISVIIALPIVFLGLATYGAYAERLRLADAEYRGITLLRVIKPLVETLARHRGMTNAWLNGDASFGARRDAQASQIDQHMASLLAQRELLIRFDVLAAAEALAAGWRRVRALEGPAPENFAQHTALVAQVLALNLQVADNSGLSLDPVLESYYLMDAVVHRLPQLVENLGQLRGKASGIAARQALDSEQTYALLMNIQQIETLRMAIGHGYVQVAQAATPAIRALSARVDTLLPAVSTYQQFIHRDILAAAASGGISVSPAQVFEQGTGVIDASLAVYDESLQVLESLLLQRVDSSRHMIRTGIALLLLTVLVITYLYVAFYLSVQRSVSAMVAAARHISGGDLSREVVLSTRDETAQLGDALNQLSRALAHTVTGIQTASRELGDSVEQVSAVAGQTRANASTQAHQTDQIASAITEMNATALEIARNTSASSAEAGAARAAVVASARRVHTTQQVIAALALDIRQAVAVMAEMAQASASIGGVLDVIKGVAEQTNLLALNAAIEAARAGDQGRGFAVVADEVRNLARKTHDSTEEIQRMIASLQARTAEAVAVIQQGETRAGETEQQFSATVAGLGDVQGGIERLHDMITGIASAAEQQTQVCEEINRNIVGVQDAAGDTAAAADQAASLGARLADQARQLQQIVGRFTLP